MAGKKTAKLASDVKSQKVFLGRKVLFVGAGSGTYNQCPQCLTRQRKGMVSEYQDKLYCNEGCIEALING